MDNPVYDIVVIGGGSVGAGVLLDAASRGYKCLLLEGSDFASGASSKSTKLIHGGVRYLQQVFEFSLQPLKNRIEKYKLVKEALDERCTMIDNASYMNHKISIVIPCTNSLWSSYYYIGSVFYHLVYWFSSRKGGISFNFPFFASR
jgi:glycerol-3-phosphate dehydrogenase